MIKKELVQKNFNKSSKSYNEFAFVQKYMATELINFVPEKFSNKRILEIGSGTGILTEKLLQKLL